MALRRCYHRLGFSATALLLCAIAAIAIHGSRRIRAKVRLRDLPTPSAFRFKRAPLPAWRGASGRVRTRLGHYRRAIAAGGVCPGWPARITPVAAQQLAAIHVCPVVDLWHSRGARHRRGVTARSTWCRGRSRTAATWLSRFLPSGWCRSPRRGLRPRRPGRR
jgi:hypothetical protein